MHGIRVTVDPAVGKNKGTRRASSSVLYRGCDRPFRFVTRIDRGVGCKKANGSAKFPSGSCRRQRYFSYKQFKRPAEPRRPFEKILESKKRMRLGPRAFFADRMCRPYGGTRDIPASAQIRPKDRRLAFALAGPRRSACGRRTWFVCLYCSRMFSEWQPTLLKKYSILQNSHNRVVFSHSTHGRITKTSWRKG